MYCITFQLWQTLWNGWLPLCLSTGVLHPRIQLWLAKSINISVGPIFLQTSRPVINNPIGVNKEILQNTIARKTCAFDSCSAASAVPTRSWSALLLSFRWVMVAWSCRFSCASWSMTWEWRLEKRAKQQCCLCVRKMITTVVHQCEKRNKKRNRKCEMPKIVCGVFNRGHTFHRIALLFLSSPRSGSLSEEEIWLERKAWRILWDFKRLDYTGHKIDWFKIK